MHADYGESQLMVLIRLVCFDNEEYWRLRIIGPLKPASLVYYILLGHYKISKKNDHPKIPPHLE